MIVSDCNNVVSNSCSFIPLSELFEYDVIARRPLFFLENGAVVCDWSWIEGRNTEC